MPGEAEELWMALRVLAHGNMPCMKPKHLRVVIAVVHGSSMNISRSNYYEQGLLPGHNLQPSVGAGQQDQTDTDAATSWHEVESRLVRQLPMLRTAIYSEAHVSLYQRAEFHAPQLALALSEQEFEDLVQQFKQSLWKDACAQHNRRLFQDQQLFQLVYEVTAGLVSQQLGIFCFS